MEKHFGVGGIVLMALMAVLALTVDADVPR